MKLVPDWRDAPKWHSTQIAALLAAFPYVWDQIPPEFKEMLPAGSEAIIAILLFAGFMIGRVRDQEL